jgi:hypothetical protein
MKYHGVEFFKVPCYFMIFTSHKIHGLIHGTFCGVADAGAIQQHQRCGIPWSAIGEQH